ncbi:hypothetical protein [Limimaricola soesokkakensis]|uniref:hypothetical protein n=1 Tax=Limimaricola soesokkakensis TaxID=1343159 RepID=UPI003517E718
MNEVTIFSHAKTYCHDTARRQLDTALAQASRAAGTLSPATADTLILLTHWIEVQLLSRGVRPSNLACTVLTCTLEVPKVFGATGCAVLQLVLRRTAEDWCLSSTTPVRRRGGTPEQCDISLSKTAQADQRRQAA